jgi:hypothetical protein
VNDTGGPGTSPQPTRLEQLSLISLFMTALLVILAAVTAYPVIHNLLSGVTVPPQNILTIALVLLLLIGFVLTFFVFRAPHPAARTPEAPAAVPIALVGDWRDIQIRIHQIYNPQSNHVSSFAMVSLQIRNAILPQSRQNITPSERTAAESANASMLALNNYLSLHASIAWTRTLLEKYATSDRTLFWAAKEVLENVVAGGAMFADNWIGMVRQAGADSLGKTLKDQWNNFREPANRLGEDLMKLARRTGDAFDGAPPLYITNIREL